MRMGGMGGGGGWSERRRRRNEGMKLLKTVERTKVEWKRRRILGVRGIERGGAGKNGREERGGLGERRIKKK
jgi:hypothetical protein